MAYRNGTYVAFDGQGTTNPTKSDMKYYALLKKWNQSENHDLNFSDSHEKTYQVKDDSTLKTLKKRLLERMKNSKNMLVIISEHTNWDRGLLNFEIGKAVDYKIPLIIAYTGCNAVLDTNDLSDLWTKTLKEKINNETAKCIHISFKEKAVMSAVSQFSVNSTGKDRLTSPLHCYPEGSYKKWGYI